MHVRVAGRLAAAGVVLTCCLAAALPATADGSTPSPSPSTTAGAAGSGQSGSKPGDKSGRDKGSDTAASQQLYEAAQALQAAQAQLDTARSQLDLARAQERAARRAEREAQIALHAAQLAEQRAEGELADVQVRIAEHRKNLGVLARNAYQSNGPLGQWSVVLSSRTPQQLVDRLAYMQSIASVGNSLVANLEEDRADLQSKRARLAAVRDQQQRLTVKATAALELQQVKTQAAQQAQDAYGLVVTARKAAVVAAQKARAKDEHQYQVMIYQSGALETRIREMAAKDAASDHPPKGTGHFVRPGTGVVTSPFGMRYHPILHVVKLHTGVDLSTGDGLVYAADRGTVIITEFNIAYGNMTVIDNGVIGGLHIATLYAHQAAFAVKPGDRVFKGQPIGVIGATGYATGPHLHFEVRIDGKVIDPWPWIKDSPEPKLSGKVTPGQLISPQPTTTP
jgi:murein DD-endopeptidase MepM/ murein hydrolase activator NlpD